MKVDARDGCEAINDKRVDFFSENEKSMDVSAQYIQNKDVGHDAQSSRLPRTRRGGPTASEIEDTKCERHPTERNVYT